MRKYRLLCILFALMLLLCGCRKDTPDTPQYSLPSIQPFSVQTDTDICDIHLRATLDMTGYESVEYIDYGREFAVLSKNNLFYVMKFDGTLMFDDAFTYYNVRSGNCAFFNNSISYILHGTQTLTFENRKAKVLKDGWYALTDTDNIGISIFDNNGKEIYKLYDKKSSLDIWLCDYYVLYLNNEFSYFQIYNLNTGDIIKEIPALQSLIVKYLGQGIFLTIEQTAVSPLTYFNEIYDAVRGTDKSLNTQIARVYNTYHNDSCQLNSPYSLFSVNGNDNFVGDYSLKSISVITGDNVYFIDNMTASVVTGETRRTTIYTYNADANSLTETLAIDNSTAGYVSGGLIIYNQIVGDKIYYGIKNTAGEDVLEAEYSSISGFYHGKAMLNSTDTEGQHTFYFTDKTGKLSPVTQAVINFSHGIYWYKDNVGTLCVNDFEGNVLATDTTAANLSAVCIDQSMRYFSIGNKLYII